MWAINLSESPRISLRPKFRQSLFNRLGFLVIVFTIILTAALYYQFSYSFTTQDSILDAHENYYYSQMVMGWGAPPDTNLVKKEIINLHMWCGIFKRENNEFGISYPGEIYWTNLPGYISVNDFYSWTISSDFENMYDLIIPFEVFFGEIDDMPVTVVDNGSHLFYLVIDHKPPNELNNLLMALIIAVIFIVSLYMFIRKYLKPVQLMKNRIEALETGDLDSTIEIIGEDELADLSFSMNKLILDINILLENKHQLLLEVSHELRSPLARMKLLIEMMPNHKNLTKLKEEVDSLEGMISNLLFSDRLSLPYSKLELKKISTQEIISEVMEMFPAKIDRVNIDNKIPKEQVRVDKTKFCLALRNLLDNAFKYSKSQDNADIKLTIVKNDNIEFQIKDSGIGISETDINKIEQPFFQANQSVSTKGFGLGLTICKKIIESHKGELTIESKPEQGAIFTLHLPKYNYRNY